MFTKHKKKTFIYLQRNRYLNKVIHLFTNNKSDHLHGILALGALLASADEGIAKKCVGFYARLVVSQSVVSQLIEHTPAWNSGTGRLARKR